MAGCYVVFHKQLGDLLLLEPAISRLRQHHGEPVMVMTRTGHAPLLQLMPGANYQAGLSLAGKSHLYCYDPLSKSALRALFTPARTKRCILPEKREMKWYHQPLFGDIIVPELGDRYVAEYFWANTPVSDHDAFRPPRLAPPPPAWKPGGIGDAPFFLVNPTSGWKKKTWLSERWAEVLNAQAAARPARFVMTSATTDWQVEHCRRIARDAGSHVEILPGTSMENFLWLCANAQGVLTVDGAASHLAQAFGTKSLTLFGPTNIHNWHYDTDRNRAVQAPPDKDGKCQMKNLSTETVAASVRALFPA